MTVHFRRFLVMLAAAFLLVPGRTGTVSAMPLEGVAVRTEPLHPAGSAALPDTVLLEQIGQSFCRTAVRPVWTAAAVLILLSAAEP